MPAGCMAIKRESVKYITQKRDNIILIADKSAMTTRLFVVIYFSVLLFNIKITSFEQNFFTYCKEGIFPNAAAGCGYGIATFSSEGQLPVPSAL